MQRRISALVGAVVILAAMAPIATAQEGPEGASHWLVCATVTGTPPDGTWDADGLQAAVIAGDATLASIDVPAACDAEAPQPVQIVESHMSSLGDTVSWLVIAANPNQDGVTIAMPVRVDALNKKGKRIGFDYGRLNLLPGQTGAIAGVMIDAKDAKSVDVIPATHGSNYIEDIAPASVELTDVKTTVAEFEGPKTTGVVSGVPTDAIGVQVLAVYRNKKGKVIGTGTTYLPGQPADGTVWETVGWANGKVKSTEAYFQVVR